MGVNFWANWVKRLIYMDAYIIILTSVFTFDFLGISVKGKTTSSKDSSNSVDVSQDLGIFIKNVLHGGAASRYLYLLYNCLHY